MSGWLTLQTIVAFLLGVFLSAMVKTWFASAKSKVA